MSDLTKVLHKILTGDIIKGFYADWYVNGYPGCIEVTYEKPGTLLFASFWFNITRSCDTITLRNDHRRASKGLGTPALKELEAAFQNIGQRQRKKIKIKFMDTDGQLDTQKWLEKNDYTYDGKNQVYYKYLY